MDLLAKYEISRAAKLCIQTGPPKAPARRSPRDGAGDAVAISGAPQQFLRNPSPTLNSSRLWSPRI